MACDPLANELANELLSDIPVACTALLIPTIFAYLSLYAFAKRWMGMYRLLTAVAILGFCTSARLVVVRCATGALLFRSAGKGKISSFLSISCF
jgi:hypothetical protein